MRHASIVVFLILLLSACVTPPRIETSQVIANDELQAVSLIKKGKLYAASGRLDLAEVEFRKALKVRPRLSSLHNDLGYTLQAQDRAEEALLLFRKAVELEPKNLAARENLARLLYNLGDTEASIKEYDLILGTYYGMQTREVTAILGKEYSAADIAAIHRALALAYYRFGQYDESICQSSLAITGPVGDFAQVGQHSRLLLSLGRSQAAANYLQGVVAVWQQQTPGRLFVDYALALLDLGQAALANESLTRSLNRNDLEEGDRRYVQLLLGMLDPKSAQSSTLPKSIVENDEDHQFCRLVSIDPYGYWPTGVVDQAKTLLSRWCHDEKQSVVSG